MKNVILILPTIVLCATLHAQQIEASKSSFLASGSSSSTDRLRKPVKKSETLVDELSRLRERLDDNWKFIVDDPKDAASADFDDMSWRTVTLPHDWSIEGRIDPKAPMGGDGGFFPSGIGWYRHQLWVPATWSGKRVQVEFEGVYMNAEVYLNGRKLATQPYGYTSFFVDLTPVVKVGTTNLLAVRVDNSQQKNSRWYSGSGIYRHVWLEVADPVHVAPWGVFVHATKADEQSAVLSVRTTLRNETAVPAKARIQTLILSPDGIEVAKTETSCELAPNDPQEVRQELQIENPALWSPEHPQLSRAITRVVVNDKVVDKMATTFGVRVLAWSADQGLTINGKTYKLSGGCIHHDNGVLGACAFDRAEERKIELLKSAGFNAIRTAHNPPSPALLDACDRLGMLVLDEAFDCWAKGKHSKDYSLYFKDWWQRDLDAMVLRDRNHPSVIMWSIGNEIPGNFSAKVAEFSPKLVERIHTLDPTRPVSNGILGWPVNEKKPGTNDLEKLKAAAPAWDSLDIVGSNYRLDTHIAEHDKFPQRVLVSTESNPPLGKGFQVADHPYVVGDFVWSAMDYLGESGIGRWFYEGDPTEPVDPPKEGEPPGTVHPVRQGSEKLFPWHGAVCGVLDILGNSRSVAYQRNITWGMGEKLHLAVRQPADDRKIIVAGWGWYPTWESWTWPGREGKPMEVEAYSRYDKVRLYLNNKLVDEQVTTRKQNYKASFKLAYEPGTLRAVGVQGDKELEQCKLVTVGEPASIRLTPDRTTLHADGRDLSFVKVEVMDRAGRLQPNADQTIRFILTGPGVIAGLGNANLKSEDPYQGNQCRAFHGRALVVIRSTQKAGEIILKANSDGLEQAAISLQATP
jgi:beta-galactosidase